ncbi:MAG TPA: glycosyltransferase [Acidimicrobiales bacterium]|nr:glycosyltransferase [Acidimicrobiales bacterium]
MRRLAVLSLHTSPLAQPGSGDGGGMNVYVRELSTALARAGVACDVYTRRDGEDVPDTVFVEPGFAVHHLRAGPARPVPKERLHEHVEEFTEGVIDHLTGVVPRWHAPGTRSIGWVEDGAGAVHANYWLSGLAGHIIKHRLDLPLISTFHTLDRVKATASPEEVEASAGARRAEAEAMVIGCSDALLASCDVEAAQLVDLYGADRERIEIVPLGVDHAFFSPGDRRMAQRAIGLDDLSGPLLLFVGRIQPLKGADVAVRALAALRSGVVADARLVIVGGPSGPHGDEELKQLHELALSLGLEDRVRFTPPQPHELLSSYYRAADCCVVPSRSESFGLVALEASACGTPVVAAAVGGLTTLVEDGRNGYLVDSGDVDGFAERVAKIVTDPGLQAYLGAAGARKARQYTWATAASRLRALHNELSSRELVEC